MNMLQSISTWFFFSVVLVVQIKFFPFLFFDLIFFPFIMTCCLLNRLSFLSFHFLAMVRSSSYYLRTALMFLRTSLLVMQLLYEIFSNF